MIALPTIYRGSEALGHSERMALPLALLSRYLFFLTRRPVSSSNLHYLQSRLTGLKSLAPALREWDEPEIDEVVRTLEALHPPGFRRLAPQLALSLLPLIKASATLPRDVVVQDGETPKDWLDGVQRVLIVFGLGIGIGDELIFAPLPRWLKAKRPGLEITILSGYRGIWDQREGVDGARHYSDHADSLGALRAEPPYDEFDLVVFADFEAPELYRGVAADGRCPRYLELSLGSRSAFWVDNRKRWLHRLHHITPYFENYYFALDHILRRFGLDTARRFPPLTTARDGEALRVFVSPFTSKYDPSRVYWTRLLSGLRPPLGRRVELVLDIGKNRQTRRFAEDVARATAFGLGSAVDVRPAEPDQDAGLSLAGLFDNLRNSSFLICSDSFAAHAGPLEGTTSLVVAKAGLEPWRVPCAGSYYFDGDAPVQQTIDGMQTVLADLAGRTTPGQIAARLSQAEVRLGELIVLLEGVFAAPADGTAAEVARLYNEFLAVLGDVFEARGHEFGRSDSLYHDKALAGPFRSADCLASTDEQDPLFRHLRDQFDYWRNSNLAKHLRTLAKRIGQDAGADDNV